jgi:hypothetical protein
MFVFVKAHADVEVLSLQAALSEGLKYNLIVFLTKLQFPPAPL